MRAKPAIYLQKTKIAKGRISFDYSVSEDLRKYFCDEQEFFVEYHEDMECVPTAVAAVIFIANVLPLVWLTDADLYLPELDTTFLDSIDELRQGYEQLFPGVAFAGRVIVDRRVDCNYLPSENRALFFSGGVDSTFSLFEHLNERPHLISLWGADLALENLRGWQEVQGQVEAIARDLNLKKAFVKTSFRKVLNTKELNKEFNERLESNWWLGVQHGIAIIAHGAPYAYKHRLAVQYIASSNDVSKSEVRCASDFRIDNKFSFAGCKVIHDGAAYNRQEKISKLIGYIRDYKKALLLRVCWKSERGNNCCNCEKCYMTIMGILAAGFNPVDYGFKADKWTMMKIRRLVMRGWGEMEIGSVIDWEDIKGVLINSREAMGANKYFAAAAWLADWDFTTRENSYLAKFYKWRKAVSKSLRGRN